MKYIPVQFKNICWIIIQLAVSEIIIFQSPTYEKIDDVWYKQLGNFRTFRGRPLVSIGSNKAASEDRMETPMKIPIVAWKLYTSNVCVL